MLFTPEHELLFIVPLAWAIANRLLSKSYGVLTPPSMNSFSSAISTRSRSISTRHSSFNPWALDRCGNGYALVMPDGGAVSLASYWQSADRDLDELLEVAIQLAEALHVLAGQQIIHKDIKPANILIHPETQQVQLIDFSISSLLPKEQQQFVNPAGLEGTLAYLAPEQTGRMNRGLDYRTDFYALGVTLYELLTGTLPFEASDPLELIHCHIAQSPVAPADSLKGTTSPLPHDPLGDRHEADGEER